MIINHNLRQNLRKGHLPSFWTSDINRFFVGRRIDFTIIPSGFGDNNSFDGDGFGQIDENWGHGNGWNAGYGYQNGDGRGYGVFEYDDVQFMIMDKNNLNEIRLLIQLPTPLS